MFAVFEFETLRHIAIANLNFKLLAVERFAGKVELLALSVGVDAVEHIEEKLVVVVPIFQFRQKCCDDVFGIASHKHEVFVVVAVGDFHFGDVAAVAAHIELCVNHFEFVAADAFEFPIETRVGVAAYELIVSVVGLSTVPSAEAVGPSAVVDVLRGGGGG